MNMHDELRDLVRRDAVKFGRFTLASGRESDIYVDMRKVTPIIRRSSGSEPNSRFSISFRTPIK